MSDLIPQVGDKVKLRDDGSLARGIVEYVEVWWTPGAGYPGSYCRHTASNWFDVVERATYEPVPEPFEPYTVIEGVSSKRLWVRGTDGAWRTSADRVATHDPSMRSGLACGLYRIVARPVKDGAE